MEMEMHLGTEREEAVKGDLNKSLSIVFWENRRM